MASKLRVGTGMRRLLLLVFVSGCLNSSSSATQSGTVPAPRAVAYDGQPFEGTRVEARGARAVTPLQQTSDDTHTGNRVARSYTGVALRRGRNDGDLGLEVDLAWGEDAEPVDRDVGDAPARDYAIAVVGAARKSMPVNDALRIGLALGVGFVDVPIRLDGNGSEHGVAGLLQLGIVPSYRSGPLVVG